MKIQIYSLAEGDAYRHILYNALGFCPTPTYDFIRNMEADWREDENVLFDKLVEQKAELDIQHIFRPFDSPEDKETKPERVIENIRRKYFDSGMRNIRKLLEKKIPFRLIPSPQMQKDLDFLLRNSPPLHIRLLPFLRDA